MTNSFTFTISNSEGFFFILLIVLFIVKKLLSLPRSNLFIFVFISITLGSVIENCAVFYVREYCTYILRVL